MLEIPEDKLEAYNRLIESHPDIERKGKTMPYTSVNGHMFTHLDKTGSMGIRLSAEERQAFLEKYNSELFVQHGAVMVEYATVADELIQNTEELKPYLDLSYEYVAGLQPKVTKKKM